MGGAIGVESEPGRGSTFWFTARLRRSDEAGLPQRSRTQDLHGLRVLIVDDNATNRELLHHLVTAWGMRDTCVDSGPQALSVMAAAARKRSLRPRDPGHDDARDGRHPGGAGHPGEPALANSRLVLLTSMGLQGDVERGRKAGIEAYLSKPVRQSELFDCLVVVMGKRVETGAGGDAGSCCRAADPHRRDDPARRGQRGEPGSGALPAGIARLHGRCRHRRPRGPRGPGAQALRPDPDGLPDAAHGRLRGHRAHPRVGDERRARAHGSRSSRSPPTRWPEIASGAWKPGWTTICASRSGRKSSLPYWLVISPRPRTFRAASSRRPLRPSARRPTARRQATARSTGRLSTASARSAVPEADRRRSRGRRIPRQHAGLLARLREAIERADATGVREAAHALKSSSANVGAIRLSSLFKELEALGRSGSVEGAPESVGAIDAEFARVKEALGSCLEGSARERSTRNHPPVAGSRRGRRRGGPLPGPARARAVRLRRRRGGDRRRGRGGVRGAASAPDPARRRHAGDGRLQGLLRDPPPARRSRGPRADAHRARGHRLDPEGLRGRRHGLRDQADELGHPEPARPLHAPGERGDGRAEGERGETRERAANRRLGNWEEDAASGDAHWSSEMYRIFGVDRTAFEPRVERLLELVHPDDRDALVRARSAVLSGRETRGSTCASSSRTGLSASCTSRCSSRPARAGVSRA